MSNVTTYIDYFRQLAVSHRLLQHDPLSETGEAPIEKKHFCSMGNNEVVSGLRTSLSLPALVVEMYENSLSNETVHDIRQRPRGSMMVLDHAKADDFADELRAYDVAESIMYDMLKKIWQDHYGADADRCNTPFKQFRFTMDITPTGRLFDGEYGYYCQFDFDFQNTFNISEPPAEGTFL